MNRVGCRMLFGTLVLAGFLQLPVAQAETLETFFKCEDTICVVEYTFTTTCAESLLLDICYDFIHLLNFAKQKHTKITQMDANDDRYTVIYEYSWLFYQSRSTYVKQLQRNLKRVIFEMIGFSQNVNIFPCVLKSDGYYEVGYYDLSRRVTYFQRTILDKKPTGFYLKYSAKATEDFLKNFESYVRKHETMCNTKSP